jgi:tRNA(adenine34) deaminase
MNDEYFMREAIKEAELAFGRGDYPIGAVLTLEDEIIFRDGNRSKSSGIFLAHAELNILKNLSGDFINKNKKKLSLYTTYEPCPMCFGAIVQINLGKLVYGTNLDKSGATNIYSMFPKFYDISRRGKIEIVGRVLEKECEEVFTKSDYFKKLVDKELISKH